MAEEALELTQRLDESVLSAWAAMAVARASAMAGRSARAVEVLTPGDGARSLRRSRAPGARLGFEALATAYADLGRRDDAARTVAEAEAHAAALGLPMAVAWAARAAAVVALRAGRRRSAPPSGRSSSAEAADGVGAVDRGRAVAAARRPRARGGRRRGARRGRARARGRRRSTACGALPHRDAAEQELRRLGRRVHRRTRPGATDGEGLAALTGRELQIAELVVDRKTNAEIAGELFLSPKTVETHLRNIFRKARRDLARRARAGGRTRPPRALSARVRPLPAAGRRRRRARRRPASAPAGARAR